MHARIESEERTRRLPLPRWGVPVVMLALLMIGLMPGCKRSPTGGGGAAAGASGGGPAARQGVVVTIFPMYDLVRTIAGPEVKVTLILPAGRTPHGYEIAPADLLALKQAAILVKAGGGVDSWIERPAAEQEANGLDSINLYELAGGEPGAMAHDHEDDHEHGDENDEHEEHEEHGGAALNPHQWLVPGVAKKLVAEVRDHLIEKHRDAADAIGTRAEALLVTLDSIDNEYRTQLGAISDRRMITFHDAFDPLAEEYGLNVVAEIYSTQSQQLTTAAVSEIKQQIAAGVRAIYIEPQFDATTTTRLFPDVKLRVLDPLGGRSEPPGYATYPEMMRSNLRTLVEGLNANTDGG